MIPQEDWDRYIDTGKLDLIYIKALVERIKQGQQLTLQDLQVYQSHGPIIELLLQRPNRH